MRYLLSMLLLFAGCATENIGGNDLPDTDAIQPAYDQVFAPCSGIIRRAIVAGLTSVDPNAYDGWSGACPGCDVDSQIARDFCLQQGLQTVYMYNSQATSDNLIAAFKSAIRDMKADDLLVFYISGHGGQWADESGDEEDGMDETICLWDGQLSDDLMGTLLDLVPAGVRVFFVSDTCNSGTNYRAVRSYRKAIPRSFAAQMIHIGGCADGKSSFGDEQGGVMTTAMFDAYGPTTTYSNWRDQTAARMDTTKQAPVYAEYGAVTDEFRNGKPLQ